MKVIFVLEKIISWQMLNNLICISETQILFHVSLTLKYIVNISYNFYSNLYPCMPTICCVRFLPNQYLKKKKNIVTSHSSV